MAVAELPLEDEEEKLHLAMALHSWGAPPHACRHASSTRCTPALGVLVQSMVMRCVDGSCTCQVRIVWWSHSRDVEKTIPKVTHALTVLAFSPCVCTASWCTQAGVEVCRHALHSTSSFKEASTGARGEGRRPSQKEKGQAKEEISSVMVCGCVRGQCKVTLASSDCAMHRNQQLFTIRAGIVTLVAVE